MMLTTIVTHLLAALLGAVITAIFGADAPPASRHIDAADDAAQRQALRERMQRREGWPS